MATQNTESSDASINSSNTKRSRWRPILLCVLVLGGCILGAATGLLIYSTSEVEFESQASFLLYPTQSPSQPPETHRLFRSKESANPMLHKDVFQSPRLVETTFEKTNGLYRLRSFENLSNEETIQFVLQNLTVEVSESGKIATRYRCNNAMDAKTTLSNLIQTYVDNIANGQKSQRDRHTTFATETRMNLQDVYRTLLQKRKQILDDLSSVSINSNYITSEQLGERLAKSNEQLSRYNTTEKRIRDALAGNNELRIQSLAYALSQSGEYAIDSRLVKEPADAVSLLEQASLDIAILNESAKLQVRSDEKLLQQRVVASEKRERREHDLVDVQEELKTARELLQKNLELNAGEFNSNLANRTSRDTVTFNVLQDATLGKPVSPNLTWLLLVGSAFGLLSGVGLSFLVFFFAWLFR